MEESNTNITCFLRGTIIMYGIVLVGVFLTGCHKHKSTPAPVISSFTLSSVSMTSASFSFSARYFQNLSISVNGKSVPVNGSSYTVNGLTANTSYTAHLVASNGEKNDSREVNFQTTASKLKVDSFGVSKITATSITFGFASSSDVTITAETLTNTNSGEQFNVLGKKTFEVTNLEPATMYTFTLKVKDKSGNEKSESLDTTTSQKASDWFGGAKVTYGKKFAIDGNAVSSEMDIKLTNLSSATKTLKSLVANFGVNGKAVKMLRYQMANSRWTVIKPKGPTGSIEFTNLSLKPGVNVIHTYFALLPNVGGVENNASLTFGFVSLDDGEKGTLPNDGSFSDPISVGTVNANAEPTQVSDYGGKGVRITILTMFGNSVAYPGDDIDRDYMFDFAFRLSGPEGARIYSLYLKNPYASFTGLVYKPNTWIFTDVPTTPDPDNISLDYTWATGNQTVSLVFPKGENGKAYTDAETFNRYQLGVGYKNEGKKDFNTDNYTPGETGFLLTSKYNIMILNSDDQVVDLSDVTVYKLNKVYLTD